MISVRPNNLSLKYQKFTWLGIKDIEYFTDSVCTRWTRKKDPPQAKLE